MKERKDDQRTRMTKNLLQGALVALLGERPLKDITVKELCQKADVNRSTFYLHYYDIYDLMEELEGSISSELNKAIGDVLFQKEQNAFSTFYTAIFALFAKHAELCTILLGENGDKAFVSRLFAMGREKCISEWLRLYPRAARAQADFYYTFVSSGCVGILQRWFDSGCRERPEEIAKQVERLVSHSIATLED